MVLESLKEFKLTLPVIGTIGAAGIAAGSYNPDNCFRNKTRNYRKRSNKDSSSK